MEELPTANVDHRLDLAWLASPRRAHRRLCLAVGRPIHRWCALRLLRNLPIECVADRRLGRLPELNQHSMPWLAMCPRLHTAWNGPLPRLAAEVSRDAAGLLRNEWRRMDVRQILTIKNARTRHNEDNMDTCLDRQRNERISNWIQTRGILERVHRPAEGQSAATVEYSHSTSILWPNRCSVLTRSHPHREAFTLGRARSHHQRIRGDRTLW